MKIESLCIHAGQEPDPTTGAVMTPVYLTSTYAQEEPGKHKGYEYSRTKNPTRTVLENCIAALENGKFGSAYASGSAAADCIMHLFNQGDHIICMDDLYGGTYRLFDKVFKRTGLEFTFIDFKKPENLLSAIRPETKAVWFETPTNPLLKLVDIAAVADICRKNNLVSIVDNTFMTSFFQRPLEFGIDIVVHSTTKYLNGHSDIIGGAIVTSNQDLAEKIYFLQNAVGAVPSPMDSFMVLRGLKTLHVRMERHEQNALEIAKFLESHSAIKRVIYPGLPSHPQHELAKSQMKGFGGMISFEINGNLDTAIKFLKRTKLFSLAESLGGVESLVEHPAIMTHASIPEEKREELGISDTLLRLSIGIENCDDLKDELNFALSD